MYPIEILSGLEDFGGGEMTPAEIDAIIESTRLDGLAGREAALAAMKKAARLGAKKQAELEAKRASRTFNTGSRDIRPVTRAEFIVGQTFGKFQVQTISFNGNLPVFSNEFSTNLEGGYENAIGIVGFLRRGLLSPNTTLGGDLSIKISDDDRVYFDLINYRLFFVEQNIGQLQFIPTYIKANNNRIKVQVNWENSGAVVMGNVIFDIVYLLSNIPSITKK